ncbi:MAG: lipid A biosynthesis acyltransferase [Nitrospira sp.]|nr:lipid A biosynthesis acyltransferase [Nitrospira sp.]MBH0185935.1 lipid A biosynthesis acyltransferase [Nitrospira sp.]
MSLAWRQQSERGSRAGIRIMAWVAQFLGRPVARALLYPICVYYLLGSGSARRAITRFRERALGRPAGWGELFRHYHAFASTILDRVYFLRGQFDLFDIRFHGVDVLDRELAKGRGCVLLGAHLGSFEAVRAMGLLGRQLDIRVLMDEQNAPLIRELTQTLNPMMADRVIQTGGIHALLQVKECLEQGGIVGVMGDRVTPHDQTIACSFFGREARFPTGPIRMAHVVQAPVVLFFGLYQGGNCYEVRLESFSGEVCVPHDRRDVNVTQEVQRFAGRLEEVSRLAPDNWFNFYGFWDDSN